MSRKNLNIVQTGDDIILIISYESLNINYEIVLKFIIFGSENSNDIDIAIIIPESIYDVIFEQKIITGIIKYIDIELKKIINNIKWKYIPDGMDVEKFIRNNNGELKELNCTIVAESLYGNNLICTRSYKGPVDETNNAFSTFNLHPQMLESNPFNLRFKRNISLKCSNCLSIVFDILYNSCGYKREENEYEWENNKKIIKFVFEKSISTIKEVIAEMPEEKKCIVIESKFVKHVYTFLAHCFTMYVNDPCVKVNFKGNPFNAKFKGSYISIADRLWNDIVNNIYNVDLINKNLQEITELFNQRFEYEAPIFYDPKQNNKKFYTNSLFIPRLASIIKRYGQIELLITLLNKINFYKAGLFSNNREIKNRLKRFCFQIAQSHSLILGYFDMITNNKEYMDESFEIFTKNKAISVFNHFKKFIMREDIINQDLFYLELNLKVFLKDYTKFLQIPPTSILKGIVDSKPYRLEKSAKEYLFINKVYSEYV